MAITTVYSSTQPGLEYDLIPQFYRYRGFYDKNPILRSVINSVADATTTSYRVKGRNSRTAAKFLDGVYGSGKQTWKILGNVGSIVAMICGNAFFEIKRMHGEPYNMVMLDPGNTKMHIKNGVIEYYQDNISGHKWNPDEIFHLSNRFDGPEPFGKGDIEPMENLLFDMTQVWDDTARIFHRYIKPMHIVYLTTDNTNKLTQFKNLWTATRETPESDLIIPKDLVDSIDRVAIPQGASLNPLEWEKLLVQRLLQSYRVPELALGTGTVNSEESSRMLYSGFRQLVRWRQQALEEMIECQLFKKLYPDNSPKIEYSFAAEPEEERWDRYTKFFATVINSNMSEDLKRAYIKNINRELKLT